MDLVTLSIAKTSESTINRKLEKKLEEYTKEQLKAVAANVDGYAEEFDNEIEEAKNNCDKDIDEASTDVDSYLNEALLDIPSEYCELSNDVDLGLRGKADKIEIVLEGDVVSAQDSSDRELRVLKLYGKTTQDGTPTPEAPIEFESVGGKGSVETAVCGKNVLDISQGIGISGNDNITIDGDTITMAAGSTLYGVRFLTGLEALKVGNEYFYSFTELSGHGKSYGLQIAYQDGTKVTLMTVHQSFVVEKPVKQVSFYFSFGETFTEDVILKGLQIEAGNKATPYEPYKGMQTLSIATPEGLRGVPALSDSEYINYIDSTGKKWICDEVDFERGVYVQRIQEQNPNISYTGTLSNGLKYGVWNLTNKPKKVDVGILSESARVVGSVSSKTENSVYENLGNIVFVGSSDDTLQTLREKFNGTKILYILATPIETPLTQEQLEAFKSLHSYYPISNIFCDENAGLKVSYIADTKNHIDMAFDSIKQIVLNN